MSPAGRIPREVVEFFNAAGGHSLIVKGPAGTGKTTFALQLTEELGEVSASHYLSARVSDESLFRQFIWLKERLKPAGLQTGLKGRLRSEERRVGKEWRARRRTHVSHQKKASSDLTAQRRLPA